jgi:hypothetical protein
LSGLGFSRPMPTRVATWRRRRHMCNGCEDSARSSPSICLMSLTAEEKKLSLSIVEIFLERWSYLVERRRWKDGTLLLAVSTGLTQH